MSGWGKDALGEEGTYQPVLKEVFLDKIFIKVFHYFHYKFILNHNQDHDHHMIKGWSS